MNADSEFIRQTVQHEKGIPEVIPLNLVFDYPVRWSRYKVLRDLLQNFYDAVGYESWLERFSFTLDEETLLLMIDASKVVFLSAETIRLRILVSGGQTSDQAIKQFTRVDAPLA